MEAGRAGGFSRPWWAMLARKGTRPKSEKTHLIEVQEHHSQQIREVLKKSERVTLLEVSYPDLVIQGP